MDFFSVFPLASSLIHWVVGIFYMLQISIFVSLLRGVLRNGFLYFLRDPVDLNYNPFRDLIDATVHKHARRVLLSIAVYGSLIVMLVFLPVKLAMRVAPSIFPLDISVSDPFTEIPADIYFGAHDDLNSNRNLRANGTSADEFDGDEQSDSNLTVWLITKGHV
ncbi:putative E3 ubiquitin ligase SUD1 isoform X1 [Apium graveolens]|uniref:putative E3 ubiquitin ligase SUD1 isoform X1 n=1 Tax=Apium graveolens TaxID=4045 RepID=UPI003D7A8A58